jgi:hypothetical protein
MFLYFVTFVVTLVILLLYKQRSVILEELPLPALVLISLGWPCLFLALPFIGLYHLFCKYIQTY